MVSELAVQGRET